MADYTVCFNAYYVTDDGTETYTDDPALITGWSVYVRTDDDAGGEFDIDEDHNVTTRDEAVQLADQLAAKYNTTDIREY